MRTLHAFAIVGLLVLVMSLAACSGASGSSGASRSREPAPTAARVRSAGEQRAAANAEPESASSSRPRRVIRSSEPVVWAMPGVRLVAPVTTPSGRRMPERVRVRTKGDTIVEGRIVRLDVALAGESAPASLAGGWLPEPGLWRAERPSAEMVSPGLGQHALVVDLPPDARGGPIWVERNRMDLRWLPPVGDEPAAALASPLPPERRRSRVLAELARAELRSPLRRWRYRLSVGRLASAPTAPPADSAAAQAGVALAGGRFDDPVIEALARQREALWRRGLADLHAMDAELAARLRARLAATVRLPATPRLTPVGFREDTIVPVWPTGQADLDALLSDLLDRELAPTTRRSRVVAWLESQPMGMGWIVADAAAMGGAGDRALARVILANLSEDSTFGSVMAAGADSPPQLEAPPAGEARVLDVPLAGLERARALTTPIGMQVGDWRATRPALVGPWPVSPPGWNVAGFSRDWTLDACLRGDARALTPDADRSTAALLYRDTDAPFSADVRDGWWLHVECQRRPGDADETLRVWFGPMGLELGAIEVRSDGEVGRPSDAKSIVAWDASRVRVEAEPGQWTATIPVPPTLIGEGGTLLLGLERIEPGGRQAWPRAMLPWQTEPGRAAADLSAWAIPPR